MEPRATSWLKRITDALHTHFPLARPVYFDLRGPGLTRCLRPVLVHLAIVPAPFLVDFLGTGGDPGCKIERLFSQQRGLGRVKNPIGKQFDAIVYQEPGQRIAPNRGCPAPAKRRHKQPINRNQSRHHLCTQHSDP